MKRLTPNLLIVTLATCLAASASAGVGSTTANFLKVGLGARGAAMGEAQSAVSDDVNAIHWNPSALANLRYQELSFMHYDLAQEVRYQQASYAHPTQNHGTFAAGINVLDYGDIKGYDAGGLPTSGVRSAT